VTGAEQRRASLVFWCALAIVTAGALWLRLEYIWAAREGKALGGDALYYHATANLVAGGRGFVNPFQYVFEDQLVQSAEHPPLFSLYLAAFSWLGFTSVTDHLLASALLGTGTVLIGGLAGREIGGRALGVVSALLLAVYPNVWRHDGMVMSETAAIFTTVLTIWLAYRFWSAPSWPRVFWVGLAIALAAMSRSEMALLCVLLVIPLVLWRREQPLVRRARWIGVAAVGFLALVGPWLVFNYARFGRPVFLSAQLEVTLATANCPGTYEGEWKGYWDLTCAGAILADNGLDGPTDPRVPEVLMDETRAYVGEHREEIPSVIAARWGRLLGVYRIEQQVTIIDTFIEGGTESVARAGIWSLWVTGGLALVGGVSLRMRRIPLTPLVAPILAVWITVTVLYTATRFRAPADASLCILAAAGVLAVGRGARWLIRQLSSDLLRDVQDPEPDTPVPDTPVPEAAVP
jgi:4-amino-4-deoxy-L-arabinose transferase-like glycosyltransferase